MKRLVLLLLLLAPFALAEEEFIFDHSLYTTQSVTVDVEVTNEIEVVGTVYDVTAKLFYHPKPFDSQQVNNIRNTPAAEERIDHYVFTWENPRDNVAFSHQSEVFSEYHHPPITERIDFPYGYVPAEMSRYLTSQEFIRITPSIRRQAEQIIGEETDAVRAVFLVGSWVKENIAYDLSSVSAEANYPSDWVLENREGVCDELTSLFIAMLRSQGIPARFVSGVAYTNLEILDTNWGPHGWAEVWFPDIGWVPYDVTYGQYGYVDATHIAVMKTEDAQTNAAEYSMRGRGGDFTPEALQRSFVLTDRGEQLPADIDLSLKPVLSRTGFGSYNRIDVRAVNLQPYYVSADLYFSQTANLTSEQVSKSILLGPYEEQTISWYVRVSEDLQEGFEYTFPLVVNSNNGERAQSDFRVYEQGLVAQREDITANQAPIARALPDDFVCNHPITVRQREPFTVVCTYPEPVEICMEGCEVTTRREFTFSFDRLGAHTVTAIATQDGASSQQILTFIVVDEPTLIVRTEHANNASFDEEIALDIILEKTSISDPQNIQVILQHPFFYEEWTVAELASTHTLDIRLPANQLARENTFTITVVYDGENGVQTASTQTTLTVHADTFGQKTTLTINSFFAWLREVFA